MIYKLIYSQQQSFVLDVERNAFIPFDPANTDYQAYLVWLTEGNEPLPAEAPAAEAPAAEAPAADEAQ